MTREEIEIADIATINERQDSLRGRTDPEACSERELLVERREALANEFYGPTSGNAQRQR